MSPPRIFVSYSRRDKDFTQRLVNDLHKAGAEVWVDVEGITAGNFMRAIDEAMAKCEWMVLVLTPSALASEYVTEETYTALHRVMQGHMRAVIPLLAAPCAPGSIPPQWDVLQRYDATQDYNVGLAGVLRAIGLSSAEPWETFRDLLDRGQALVGQKQYDQAIPLLEQAAQVAPNDFYACIVWMSLALAHDGVGHWQEAVGAYDHVLAIKPKDASAWSNKSEALRKLGHFEEATEAADQAISLQPDNGVAWYTKFMALESLGRRQEAREAFKRVMQLHDQKR